MEAMPVREHAPVALPAAASAELPEQTPEEIKNGWTREALAKYRAEMDRASANRIAASMQRRHRPATCDTDYPVSGL